MLSASFPAGLTAFIVIAALVVFGQVFHMSDTDISAVSALLMTTVGMLFLYRISCPMNAFRWTIWLAMLAGLIFSCVFLSDLFGISPLSLEASLLLGVFMVATEPVLRYLTKLLNLLQKCVSWLVNKAASLFLLD